MPRAEDPEDVRVVVTRLEAMQDKLEEIHDEVKRTNGRVTILERSDAIHDAIARRESTAKDWSLRLLVALVAVVALAEPVVLALLKL